MNNIDIKFKKNNLKFIKIAREKTIFFAKMIIKKN